MSLTGLLDVVASDPALAEAAQSALAGDRRQLDLVGPPAARPFAVAALARALADAAKGQRGRAGPGRHRDRPRGRGPGGGARLAAAAGHRGRVPRLGDPAARAALAPFRHRRPTARGAAPDRHTRRADDPAAGPLQVVVAPDPQPCCSRRSSGLAELAPVSLAARQEADLEDLVRRLVAAAYQRVDLVEQRGEFAVRGGILDVFPPTEEHPLRVEFWGDEVEEIRYFKVADQRSLEVAQHGLWAPPCRELLLTDAVGARAPGARGRAPGAGGHPRQDRRGHRRRGHGVAGAGAGRRHGAAGRRAAAGQPRRRLRP